MEYLDIVDEMGNPTGEIVEREYAHRHGIRHRTSHVWLLRKKQMSKFFYRNVASIKILIQDVMIFQVLVIFQQEVTLKLRHYVN